MSPDVQEGGEVAFPALRARVVDLTLEQVVVHGLLDVTEHSDGRHADGRQRQPAEREGQARLGVVLVVDEQRVLPHLVDRDDLGGAVLADAHAALTVGAEAHGLAVPEVDAVLLGVAHRLERVVVVDVAVLEDLDERRAAVCRRPSQHLGHVLAIGVDAPARRSSPRRRWRRRAG